MSLLVVGLSHKGAPLATLERVALTGDALDKLLHDVAGADDVAGALVLSTSAPAMSSARNTSSSSLPRASPVSATRSSVASGAPL